MSVMQALANHYTTTAAASKNPFDGVVPNFSIFGADFNAWWKKLLAGVWGLAIVYCGFKLFPAALSMHRSRRVGNAMTLGEASQDLQFWGVGTAIVVSAGLLFGAILFAAG
ncbi:MAG TPA: hypothetical protein VE442_18665 [Jatrophihabitans sp.]|nr:hypothetical protein [Jatrophihabitans sp.]